VSDVEGNLSEHPEEAQAVRMAFKLKEEGFSLQHIADEFNMMGYKTKSGSRFQPVTIMRILNYEPNLKLLRNDD
jgi:N-acetyl-anhydromuramyl-L-alanine amidase AmpD